MKYLLDTHILLWRLFDDRRLPKDHVHLLERVQRTGAQIGISAISLWEIAKLVERGRLDLNENVNDLLERIIETPNVAILELTRSVAVESTLLGARFPNDPADQIIAATARCHGLTLLTADQRIIDSGAVTVA